MHKFSNKRFVKIFKEIYNMPEIDEWFEKYIEEGAEIDFLF